MPHVEFTNTFRQHMLGAHQTTERRDCRIFTGVSSEWLTEGIALAWMHIGFTQPPGDKATISVVSREAKYVTFSHSSRKVDLRLVLANANKIRFGSFNFFHVLHIH